MIHTATDLGALDVHLTRAVLIDRLEHTLQFARDLMRDMDRDAPFWNEEIDPHLNCADKAIVEVGLFLLLASRIPDPSPHFRQLLNDVAILLSAHTDTVRNRGLLMRFPPSAAAFGISSVALKGFELLNPEFEDLVLRAFGSGLVEATERLPYRAMDVRWLRGLLDLSQPPVFDDLLPLSILTSRAHPVQMSIADAYALTHAVMYLTDFGRRSLPVSLDVQRIAATIDASIAWNLAAQNLDLLGENLILASLIGTPWSYYARYGWRCLMMAWDDLGFLPSPSFDPSLFLSQPNEARRHYASRHVYHTMFVTGILCAVMLRDPASDARATEGIVEDCDPYALSEAMSPPAILAADTDSERTESTLHTLLLHHGHQTEAGDPIWLNAIPGLTISRDERIAVLADGLMIVSAQRYELAALAAALSTIAISDVPLSLTFREALAFLKRQRLPSSGFAPCLIAEGMDDVTARTLASALDDCLELATSRLNDASHAQA